MTNVNRRGAMLALPKSPGYLPFDGETYRPTMGLVALDLDEWIEIDEDMARDLALKRDLLATRHGDVFECLPEALAGSQEVLDLLVRHLIRRFPTLYSLEDNLLLNRVTGEEWRLSGSELHPLDLAGRLVQEDLCLMERNDDGWRLTAGSLCAPSRWSLAEKMGKPMAAIHAPVPLYAEKLARPVDRFFDKMVPGKAVWRANWSVKEDPTLFQPIRYQSPEGPPATPETAGDRVYLRVERQTLRRLPQTDAILFTIRTYVRTIADSITTSLAAERLARSVAGLPPDVAQYKNVSRFADALIAWLNQKAASPR
jgi:hypothetical protein